MNKKKWIRINKIFKNRTEKIQNRFKFSKVLAEKTEKVVFRIFKLLLCMLFI